MLANQIHIGDGKGEVVAARVRESVPAEDHFLVSHDCSWVSSWQLTIGHKRHEGGHISILALFANARPSSG